MAISDSQVDEVRQKADIVALLGEETSLRQAGATFRGPCPLHGGEGPNFSVDPRGSKPKFQCFVCGAGGDVFEFFMQARGLKFPDAVRFVAGQVGVEIEEESYKGPRRKKPEETRLERKEEALAAIRELARRTLEERFKDGVEIPQEFNMFLGILPPVDEVIEYLTKIGVKPRAIKDLGLQEPSVKSSLAWQRGGWVLGAGDARSLTVIAPFAEAPAPAIGIDGKESCGWFGLNSRTLSRARLNGFLPVVVGNRLFGELVRSGVDGFAFPVGRGAPILADRIPSVCGEVVIAVESADTERLRAGVVASALLPKFPDLALGECPPSSLRSPGRAPEDVLMDALDSAVDLVEYQVALMKRMGKTPEEMERRILQTLAQMPEGSEWQRRFREEAFRSLLQSEQPSFDPSEDTEPSLSA